MVFSIRPNKTEMPLHGKHQCKGIFRIFQTFLSKPLDKIIVMSYNNIVVGVWRRLVARYLGVVEAVGSSPVTPTIRPCRSFARSFLLYNSLTFSPLYAKISSDDQFYQKRFILCFPSEQRATLVSIESFSFSVIMIVLSPLAGFVFTYW